MILTTEYYLPMSVKDATLHRTYGVGRDTIVNLLGSQNHTVKSIASLQHQTLCHFLTVSISTSTKNVSTSSNLCFRSYFPFCLIAEFIQQSECNVTLSVCSHLSRQLVQDRSLDGLPDIAVQDK